MNASDPSSVPDAPATLHVDLQSGFVDDRVEIEVNGSPIFGEHGVTTMLLTGLAAEVSATVASGDVDVVVRVPTAATEASARVTVPASGECWIGIALETSQIRFVTSDTEFFYG